MGSSIWGRRRRGAGRARCRRSFGCGWVRGCMSCLVIRYAMLDTPRCLILGCTVRLLCIWWSVVVAGCCVIVLLTCCVFPSSVLGFICMRHHYDEISQIQLRPIGLGESCACERYRISGPSHNASRGFTAIGPPPSSSTGHSVVARIRNIARHPCRYLAPLNDLQARLQFVFSGDPHHDIAQYDSWFK